MPFATLSASGGIVNAYNAVRDADTLKTTVAQPAKTVVNLREQASTKSKP